MALIKVTTNEQGLTASYWTISKVDIDRVSKSGIIMFDLFEDKQKRDNGFKPLVRDYANVYPLDYDEYFGLNALQAANDPYECAYRYLKEKVPFFIDALDDLEEL